MCKREPLEPRGQGRQLAVLVPGSDLARGRRPLLVLRIVLKVPLSFQDIVDLVSVVGPPFRRIVHSVQGTCCVHVCIHLAKTKNDL